MLVKIGQKIFSSSDIILFMFFAAFLVGSGQHNTKFMFIMFVYLLFLNVKILTQAFMVLLRSWPLLVVIVWCFASSLWSIWPNESRYTTITQVLLILTCSLLVSCYSKKSIIFCLKWASVLFISINIFYFFLFPGSSFAHDGAIGITNHKNSFGLITALSLISLLSCYQYTPAHLKRFDLIFIFAGFVFLFLSFSKTSISLLFFSLIFSFVFTLIDNRFLYLFGFLFKYFSWFFILILFSAVFFFQEQLLYYLYYNYDDDFMTGRGRIWMTLLLDNAESLTHGLGFGSVWDKGEYSAIFFTDIYKTDPLWAEGLASSDGGYTDLLLSIGLIGTGLFFYYLMYVFSCILRSVHTEHFLFICSFFIFIVFHNFSETSFMLSSVNIWFLFVLVSFVACSQRR